MFYVFIIGIISAVSLMALKSSYVYQQGMNSDRDIINSDRLEILYQKEIVLKNAIDEYIRDKGIIPIDIAILKTEGYLGSGFDIGNFFNIENISFSVVDNKVEITQKILDSNIRNKYLNQYNKKTNDEIGNEYISYEDSIDNTIVHHKYMLSGSAISHLSKGISMVNTLDSSLFKSCKAIKEYDSNLGSGVYSIDPDGDGNKFNVYCDMVTDGGGWTLVWSNLEDFANDLQEGLSWSEATDVGTTSEPLINGVINNDIFSFEVYTPLDIWNQLMNNSKGDLLYQWTSSSSFPIEKQMKSNILPFSDIDYTLRLSNPSGDIADIYTYHNNNPFSTTDNENTSYGNCVAQNKKQPFWYKSTNGCWSGSIFGGNTNGAYFFANDNFFASSNNGLGAGSALLFIR